MPVCAHFLRLEGRVSLRMVGKDGKVELKRDIVKQGFMVKRSQNKKRFTPINYKQRFFVLTRNCLFYYDSDGERRKERGRIAIESVHVVETATLGAGSGSDVAAGSEAGSGGGGVPPGLPFQVGYREAGQEYTLYLLAAREQDRAEWIRALRAVCSENPGLSGRYHAGLWSGKRWSCCRLSTRSAEGCDTCSSWSSSKPPPNTTTNSSSPSPAINTITNAVAVEHERRTPLQQQQQQQQQLTGTTTTTTTSTTTIGTAAETNNNPVIQSQARSTIGVCRVFSMQGGHVRELYINW